MSEMSETNKASISSAYHALIKNPKAYVCLEPAYRRQTGNTSKFKIQVPNPKFPWIRELAIMQGVLFSGHHKRLDVERDLRLPTARVHTYRSMVPDAHPQRLRLHIHVPNSRRPGILQVYGSSNDYSNIPLRMGYRWYRALARATARPLVALARGVLDRGLPLGFAPTASGQGREWYWQNACSTGASQFVSAPEALPPGRGPS